MDKINFRIQRNGNLNDILVEDVAGPGNGRHNYVIRRADTGEKTCGYSIPKGCEKRRKRRGGYFRQRPFRDRPSSFTVFSTRRI